MEQKMTFILLYDFEWIHNAITRARWIIGWQLLFWKHIMTLCRHDVLLNIIVCFGKALVTIVGRFMKSIEDFEMHRQINKCSMSFFCLLWFSIAQNKKNRFGTHLNFKWVVWNEFLVDLPRSASVYLGHAMDMGSDTLFVSIEQI